VADRHVDARLSAFLDDELDDDAAIEVARHVDACPRCLRELEAVRATRDALRSLPSLQAPVLTSGLERRQQRWERARRRARVAAAATLVPAVLFGLAYVAGGDTGEVVPPMERFVAEHLTRTVGPPTLTAGDQR
jgi:anti-sigma factor RsiW